MLSPLLFDNPSRAPQAGAGVPSSENLITSLTYQMLGLTKTSQIIYRALHILSGGVEVSALFVSFTSAGLRLSVEKGLRRQTSLTECGLRVV